VEDLSLILWRERELLETLLYKLEQEQLVLASGKTRWLPQAAREVESVLGTIRQTEVLRAIAVDAAARSVGLGDDPSLRELAESVIEPWRAILLDHRAAFLSITREIEELAATNRDLLTAGYRAARETLMSLGESTESYSSSGSAVTSEQRHRLVDRSI
jgi:hypothetical protein